MTDPELQSRNRSFLSEVLSVDVVDQNTFVINTEVPSRALIRQLTYYGLIVPHTAKIPAADGIDLSVTPIGTGPYRFVSYSPGENLILERNENYWGSEPRLETIEFRIIPENGTRVAALESGEAHFIMDLPLEARERLMDDSNIVLDTAITSRVININMRHDLLPTSDPRVRQAIAHAIDVDLINTAILQGLGMQAGSVLGPNIDCYHPMEPYAYDPELARELLREAGAEGAELIVYGGQGGFLLDKDVTEAVASMLTAVGFDVELQILEWAAYLDAIFAPDAQVNVWVASWGVNSLNPDMLMTTEFHSVKGRDRYRYHNTELDNLIDQARQTLDDAAACDLYAQAQEILWRDLPWYTMYVQPDAVAHVSNLKGWFRTLGDDYYRFSEAYLE